MPDLSIAIPTYNRKDDLKNLLRSITKIKNLSIEVVIVDDGSDDGTKDFIDSIPSKKFKVIYEYQKNQGRAFALHKAINLCNGTYAMIMDSDDLVVPLAIEKVVNNYLKNEHKEIIGAFCLTNTMENNLIGKKFKKNYVTSSYLKQLLEENIIGDKKEIIKTSMLKNCLYSPIYGEKRMPTSSIWLNLPDEDNLIFLNEVIALKDYQENGMTKNINAIRIKSPISSYMFYLSLVNKISIFRHPFYYVKSAVLFWRFKLHAKNDFRDDELAKEKRMPSIIFLIFGFLLTIFDKVFYKDERN